SAVDGRGAGGDPGGAASPAGAASTTGAPESERICMNGIPVLTIEDVATLDGVLGDFLKKAEADLTVVIDRGGNVISQFGDRHVTDVTIIAALAAGSFAATRELARRIGEVEFNALYRPTIRWDATEGIPSITIPKRLTRLDRANLVGLQLNRLVRDSA